MRYGTRTVLGVVVLVVLLLAALLPGGVLGQGEDVLEAQPRAFELVQGWYQGRETFYYDFGANTMASEGGEAVVTAPIWALVTGLDDEGNPQFVEGQANIIDVLPGQEGYSDLWQVNLVTVPEDYEANTLRSAQEVEDSGYEIQEAGQTVNCPVLRTAQAEADMTPTAPPTPEATGTPELPGTLPETGGTLAGGAVPLVASGAALVGLGVGLWRRRSGR